MGVSVATVWRMLRRGQLASVRQAGRRLISAGAIRKRAKSTDRIASFTEEHPIFRLIGAGRGGGGPGARDKHELLGS